MLLILRRHGNTVDSTLHVVSGQEAQRVARVHSERPILRLGPFPGIGLVVPDLEGGDWLAEKEGEASEV